MKKLKIISIFTLFLCSVICLELSATAHPILNDLTLEQKIGQLFVVTSIPENEANKQLIIDKGYRTDAEYVKYLITEHHVGGVIFLGSGTCEKQVALTQEFQQVSEVPLLIAQDCEWGLTMRLHDAPKFPRNQLLGALSPEHDYLIYEMGHEVGRECKLFGVHMNLAPVVDVNNNQNNPVINDRSFGENKERVARKGELFMRGLQDAGVAACAKHFPGHGDTNVDSHYDLPRLLHSREHLHDCELYPFKHMITHGVKAIMSAHLEIPSIESQKHLPSSLSHTVITKILKKELGFDGVVVTDGLDMKGVTKHHAPGELELKAIQAGNDILLCSTDVPKAIAMIKHAVLDGRLSEEDLNMHVTKILVFKEWVGCNNPIPDFNFEQLHSPKSQSLKQQLYSHAVTVVRDTVRALPLTLEKRGAISCIQIGHEDMCDFNKILAQELSISPCIIAVQEDLQSVKNLVSQIQSDTVIVSLLSMSRFAREQFGISQSTVCLLQELKKAGKQVIVVVFGNAYSLPLVKDASTVIMAYENDIDAQLAAAQVVLGMRQATGALPVLNMAIQKK